MPIVPTRPGTLVLMKGVRRTAPHELFAPECGCAKTEDPGKLMVAYRTVIGKCLPIY